MTTVDVAYDRQTGIFDPAKNENAAVTFVGCGGIGSFAAFAVAKLGVQNLTLVDPDVVEAHNIPSQMYDITQADEAKVEALTANIEVINPGAVRDFRQEFLADMPKPSGLVVSGLDSMTARIELWEKHLRMNPNVPLYIDGRIDGQLIVIYAVKPWDLEDVEQYEATLLSDDEVPAGVCTERAIIDVGFMVGSLIARLVRRHYTDQEVEKITYVNQKNLDIMKGGWIG